MKCIGAIETYCPNCCEGSNTELVQIFERSKEDRVTIGYCTNCTAIFYIGRISEEKGHVDE